MKIDFLDRYRKRVEQTLWVLIIYLGITVNIIHLEPIVSNRLILDVLLVIIALYTFVYYRYIAPRVNTPVIMLVSTTIFLGFSLMVVFLSGGFSSIYYGILYGALLIGATLIGSQALLTLTGMIALWILVQYFVGSSFGLASIDPLWQLIGRFTELSVIAFILYGSSKEINARMFEQQLTEDEKNKLRETVEREKNIIGSIEDMVVAIDIHGNIILTNTSFQKFIGKSADEMMGTYYQDVFTVHKCYMLGERKDIVDILESERNTLLPKHTTEDEEVEYKLESHKDSKLVEFTVSPLHDADSNKEEGIVVVFRDVSEKQQLELMKLDFVSMAAHELRTPITTIRGYIHALKEEMWNELEPDKRMYINRTEMAALQLVTLVENLLSVSRIERNSFTVETRETNWVNFIKQKVEEYEPRAFERGLNMTFVEPETDIPMAIVDPLRIAEVINNLLNNAISFTMQGNIEVSIEHDMENNMIVTHVKDTGQGIPEDAQNHLFEKFFRVSGTLQEGSKGTGLGLYISKHIVDMHYGHIWVQSKLNEGSVFSFSVPSINNIEIIRKFEEDRLQLKFNHHK